MLSTTITTFPADDVSVDIKKSAAFARQAAQACYGRWYAAPTPYGSGGVVYGNMQYFSQLKYYAEGRQTPEKYKKIYRGENVTNGKPTATPANGNNYGENARRGYNNIGFDQNSIVTPAPVFISVIKALLSQSDYKVVVSSNSETDIKTKEKMKWKLYVDQKVTNPLKQELGIPYKKPDWWPETKAELELYEKYHGFRLPLETAFSKIAEHSFDISDWTGMREKILDSAIQTSFLVSKIYTNGDGSVRTKYINPSMYITVWDDDNPNAEPPFAGHIEKVPISILKVKLEPEGVTDEDLKGMARMYATANNIGDPNSYNWNTKDPVTQRYGWYDFLVDVMCFEYKSDDKKIYVGRNASNGNYVYKQEDKVKKKYADGRERKTDTYYNQNIYEGCWVIGTKWVYDYGLQRNIIREADGSACLSYVSERITGKSIVERWQSLLDDYQIGRLKLRSAVLAAAPKGLSIDVAALANMDLGYGKMSAIEIARVRRETGNQFWLSRLESNGNTRNVNSVIQELEGGIGKQLDEWLVYLGAIERDMMRVAGLTDTSVATPNASPEKLVGMGQLEMNTTSNSLYTIQKAVMRIKEKLAKKVIQKVRVNIEGDPKCADYYRTVLGESYFTAVKSVGDISLSKMGIKLKATTTAQRKQYIMGLLAESLKAGKNGQIGITTADALYVEKTLEEGYDELAAWYLAVAEERVARQIQEKTDRATQMNAEMQAQAAERVEAAKAKTAQMVSQLKTSEDGAKIANELQAKLAEIEAQMNADLQTITLEATLQASTGREITGKV